MRITRLFHPGLKIVYHTAKAFLGLLLLLICLSPKLTMAQDRMPVSGTTIGNQASATYIDANGNRQTVTSNSVETVVQQVASLALSSGLDVTVSAGGQALYPHTITNKGNGTDFFTLTAVDANTGTFDFSSLQIYADANQDGVPDDLSNPISQTPNLGPGEQFSVVIAATTPSGLTAGDTEDLTLTATSNFDNAETATATSSAIISDAAIINVTQSMSQTSGSPADSVTITFTFTNTGNTTGTNLTITDNLPVGFNYATGTAQWSGSGSALTDAAGGDPSGISYEFNTGTITAVINSLSPGQTGTLSFKVTVSSGTEGQQISTVGTYIHDDITNSLQTNTVTFTVGGDYGVAIPSSDPSPVVINSAQQGGTIYFTNRFENIGTLTDLYNITLDNSSYPDGTTVILYASDGNGNPTNPLADSNGDGIPDTGPVTPGEITEVILQISLPPDVSGNNAGSAFMIQKTATSVNDPTKSATQTDQLGEITPNQIDLTADAPLGDANVKGSGTTTTGETDPVEIYNGAPGSVVTFDLYVNNPGPQEDSFNLTASTDNSFGTISLPEGWSVEFRDPENGNSVITNTGAVPAGSNKHLTVAVTLPANSDPVTAQSLFIRALSPVSGASDVIHTAVGITTGRRISIVPSQTGQVAMGSSIVYAHILTNESNITENDGSNSTLELELTNSEANGFLTKLYLDVNEDGVIDSGDELILSGDGASDLSASVGGLAAGEQVHLLVKVTATAGVPVGQINTTTISVTDRTNTSVNGTTLPEASVSDRSTVVASALTIIKEQALDNGSGGPGTYQTADLRADPGDTIYYRITVKNATAEPVTNVEVTDVTPPYTTLSGTVSATGDGAPAVSSAPANGGTGTITVTATSLQSGGSFVIEFAVQIDS